MDRLSTFKTTRKAGIAILFGLLSLLLSPYGIQATVGEIKIDIPWSLLFPILASMAFGWRYALVAGLFGGALFPFLLWPTTNLANIPTAFLFLGFYMSLGLATDMNYFRKVKSITLRILSILLIFIVCFHFYDVYLVNSILALEPSTIKNLPLEMLYGFAFKDSTNIIVLTLVSQTLLRLPIIRRLMGLSVEPSMQSNNKIFIITIGTAFLVWLLFIGLGFAILRGNNALLQEHIALALLVILFSGFLVTRIFFHYNESQFEIQHQLYKSEKKYRTIFENVQDVFYQTTLEGVFIEVSPSIKRYTGLDREEMIGSSIQSLYYNLDDRAVLVNAIREKGELRDCVFRIKKNTGESLHVSVNARLVYDSDGSPTHIDGALRDVSERKKNELKIANQNKKLQIQNRELEQFAYIASHDLQEPLLILKYFSELLKDEFSDQISDDTKQYLDFIFQSSIRMELLVKGLLDYSRIGIEGELVTVDCNQILNDVLHDMDVRIKESNAQITADYLPVLNGYETELRQLFQNLICNALKFRKKQVIPEIKITAKKQENHWLFSVQDNGIGIAERDKDKIFVIFKRLNNRLEYEGTGIGLSHCKKIAELHGGTIWVESKLGEGSVFNFTTPRFDTIQTSILKI